MVAGVFYLQYLIKFFSGYFRLSKNGTERSEEKGLGMHGDGHSPAISMTKTEMATFFINQEKTQFVQGSYHIFWIHFSTHHIMPALPHEQW